MAEAKPDIHAYQQLKVLMQDPDYAWGWHCNLAVPIMDSIGVSHATANRAGAALMMHLWGVDITKHPDYAYPNHDPYPNPLNGDMLEAIAEQRANAETNNG